MPETKNTVKKVTHSRSFLLHFLPTGMVFLTLLAATIWGWVASIEAREDEQNRVVSQQAFEVEQAITNRFGIYTENLRGASGVFSVSEDVSRDQWKTYVTTTNLSDRLPGIRGIGYAPYIRPGGESDHIARVQSEPDFSEYSLFPAPTSADNPRVPALYIEPLEPASKSSLGFDMFTNEIRRSAMERARDSSQPVMTAKINLVNRENPNLNRPGFIMYSPIYSNGSDLNTVDQRRAAITGYAYMTFRADDLFAAIFGDDNKDVGFQIYSGPISQQNLLYKNANYDKNVSEDSSLSYTSDFILNSQRLTIRYSISDTIVNRVIANRPMSMLISGILASLLISGFVLVLLIGRTRSLAAIKEHEVQTAKDDLLSLASHQLRTPATGVKQYLGMILEGYVGKVSVSQREYIQKAYDSNERQLGIINELLYVAKAEAGRIVLTKRDVNLNSMLETMINEQQGTAKDKSITLSLSIPKKPIVIYADTHSLHMALENVINNAIKYTPSGGSVSVGARRAPGEIRVYVRDTGVGIPAEKIETVFKQFARVDNALSASAGGSGIGLYLSKHLIELHGGSIDVSSRVGRGSVFTAHLPNESASDIIERRDSGTKTKKEVPKVDSDATG